MAKHDITCVPLEHVNKIYTNDASETVILLEYKEKNSIECGAKITIGNEHDIEIRTGMLYIMYNFELPK